MKVAFIVGFYSRVEAELRGKFANAFDDENLVWIGRTSKDKPDLPAFKDRFFKVLDDGSDDPIHIFLAVLRNEPWVATSVDGIIRGHGRVRLATLPNALDSAKVVGHIKELGLSELNIEIRKACLVKYLDGKEVLCVRPTWQTSFENSLRRAGFPPGCVGEYFCESIVQPSRNSNLPKELRDGAKQYAHLLYAYKSLRHAPKDLRRQYEGYFFQDETTAGVVDKLKKDILG